MIRMYDVETNAYTSLHLKSFFYPLKSFHPNSKKNYQCGTPEYFPLFNFHINESEKLTSASILKSPYK